ncbi:asparagine synthase (glutamine-hydrolyzing) [Rhizobium leguminosarum]|uniref:asparagine synthase (glutamine-hydrolyzing) n=1 Tax=Rhizobium leguminosarum TaxID=384 RepID=UPI001C955091|nr:asparagine synthase (glutamine-hydrolyzing) [Rhizobium leguminosarum]MBY5707577.1 asparagine synthase (glutamine-hydrolyzing) [Rhizobium leguminosarum]MBY5714932.1 asparagine synthase (glutamine-hydrolyzing) [Rhizobium leguminosarum]
MCGVVGYLGYVADGAGLLARMAAAIAHRGPDGEGISVFPQAGLAHRRLAIVDLGNGQQPMSSENGRFVISFNGEIFNHVELRRDLEAEGHRFRTSADTEVILHLFERYGERCLSLLNGDFAFAIWDSLRERMFLARDRMGVRPLFYTRHRGAVYFASEVKSLLRVPGLQATLDIKALDQILTLWAPIAPRTAFQNIFELEPATYAVIDRNGMTTTPYWKLEFPDHGDYPGGAAEEELEDLLMDAVRLRLRADVQVGCYLSGGLDSSVIAAIASRLDAQPLRTFAIAFESREHDESYFQSTMVDHLQTRHVQTLMPSGDIAADFPDVVRHMERPVIRSAPAPLYALARLVRSNGIKAVLTGEGADEIFAGYDLFKEAKVRRFCARQPGSRFRPLLFRKLYPYLPNLRRQTPEYLSAFFMAGSANIGDPLFSHRPRFRSTASTKMFFSRDVKNALGGYDAAEEIVSLLPSDFRRWHPLNQAQYLETRFLLPGYILSSQGDRMAMAHGIEGRFPFLDHRLVEFAARLHPEHKLKGLDEKHVLRAVADKLLPKEISERRKQPYRAPDTEAFVGETKHEFVDAALGADSVRRSGIFDPVTVEKLHRKCAAGAPSGFRDNAAFVAILSTQLWQETFAAGSPSRAVA